VEKMARQSKKLRQEQLERCLEKSPFVTDEELAIQLGVSIPTIRLDRMELGIPELRERTRQVAQEARTQLKAIASDDVTGEIIDLELGKTGLSTLLVTPDMVFAKTHVARGHHIFAQANSLALAVMDAPAAVTGVANIKFKIPVREGEKLIAKAEVVRTRANKNFIWVKTRSGTQEVFRAKFIMVSLEG
jgi:acyl-coenzyme A thioesterase PaaI-like protein